MIENGRQIYQAGIEFNKKQITNLLAIFTSEEQEQILQLADKLTSAITNFSTD